MKWQLPERNLYINAKTWFCGWCDEMTPIEKNPEWDEKLNGENAMPEWFVRCGQCHHPHNEPWDFDCPQCGYPSQDEESIIKYGDPQINNAVSMEYGGKPEDWEETHRCLQCGIEFTFMNSNY